MSWPPHFDMQQQPLTPVLQTAFLDSSPFVFAPALNSIDYNMPSGHDERASPKGLTAQGQLSARPSPRLHASASMPNIWRGESPSPLSVRRTPSRLRLIPDDANNSQMISPLGLHIPASTRLSEGRDPGQPLTPPMSPNAPTSYQTNQQQSFGASRISPFRGSPPSFNPFSSYNCMLPSPARSTHHTQQPIAEETQNPALNSASLVQFPLTEQQPALVPDSEHDDSASESPTLVTPSTLVSPSRRTHLDSPVSILDYGAGIPRSGRLLLVSHVPRDATDEEVLYNFSVLGDLKGLYVRYLASNGVVILAFFDMRDAARAHRYHLRARRFFGDSVALESHFISPTQLSKLGASSFVDECEGEVYISTMGEGTLNQTALQNALASYGGLRQFRVVGLHGKAILLYPLCQLSPYTCSRPSLLSSSTLAMQTMLFKTCTTASCSVFTCA
ncbi:hypothetical protein CALCODRAFT_19658 [Calocera cornea HHB12733]|uniref:RRM domain-containing protein n=1 Tax=Calocera cornea HHB12733 TaxID=1353952 RepID=A0A165E6I4_9BASI|nr:hypothetical protein CALCODRAFT_19658 [Calocera cornea HHB12733]